MCSFQERLQSTADHRLAGGIATRHHTHGGDAHRSWNPDIGSSQGTCSFYSPPRPRDPGSRRHRYVSSTRADSSSCGPGIQSEFLGQRVEFSSKSLGSRGKVLNIPNGVNDISAGGGFGLDKKYRPSSQKFSSVESMQVICHHFDTSTVCTADTTRPWQLCVRVGKKSKHSYHLSHYYYLYYR